MSARSGRLVHDVTLTFGLFSLTGMEFDLNIIAALLTIIGYSLNDTVVIYDRIRENLMKYRKMDMAALLDLSVNETLSRTVMTSVSISLPLIILVLFGPDVIFGFSAAMAFGIVVGTYSSIYQAAPILIWLKVGPHSFVPSEGTAPKPSAQAKASALSLRCGELSRKNAASCRAFSSHEKCADIVPRPLRVMAGWRVDL